MTRGWNDGWQAAVEATVQYLQMCQQPAPCLERWAVDLADLEVTELTAMWLSLDAAARRWKAELVKREEPDDQD